MSKIYGAIPSFPSLSSLSYLSYLNGTMTSHSSPSSSLTSSLASSLSSISGWAPDPLRPLFTLSYPVAISIAPSSPLALEYRSGSPGGVGAPGQSVTLYDKGIKDAYFVAFCALAFTVAREITMRYVWAGLARWYLTRQARRAALARGKAGRRRAQTMKQQRIERRKREHVVTRFAEQGWSFTYCTLSWSTGALILSRLNHPLSPQSLWSTYPHILLPALTKFYYLAQLGWWFHQIFVLNTEKRRHDHWQMFSHHVLTIALIVGSYLGNFTRVGTVIHVLMDFCDILLPLAKMLRYLSFTTSCDIAFLAFLVGWLVTRQIGLSYVILTTYRDSPRLIPHQWSPESGVYFTQPIYWGYLVMLTSLLGLATAWFIMALRVAVRVVRGQGAEDSRSDDEDGGEEEGEDAEGDGKKEEEEEEEDDGEDEAEVDNEETWDERLQGKVMTHKEVKQGTKEVKQGVKEVKHRAMAIGSSSPEDSSSPISSGTGTPRGVQGVNVNVQGLKGLACKRDELRSSHAQNASGAGEVRRRR